MKGHVLTPTPVASTMVGRLFKSQPPRKGDQVLDPGCGEGTFIASVIEYCQRRSLPIPDIIGVELDSALAAQARRRFAGERQVKILQGDFLVTPLSQFRYIIGNPPYVPITGLSVEERRRYRSIFASAVERFDLYSLFFERALFLLAPGGRLCLITPEKFQYVHSATPLRRILAAFTVESLVHLDEDTFPGLVTYPTVTTVLNQSPRPSSRTLVVFRDGSRRSVALPADGASWASSLNPVTKASDSSVELQKLCLRISCGIATGADGLYVFPNDQIPPTLESFAHPTVSGRQLGLDGPTEIKTTSSMLVPYDRRGRLLPPSKMGDFLTFVSRPDVSRRLRTRTCVRTDSREWYRFHDNVPLEEILRPKILCKDIASEPHFWADADGRIVPRHTVYYIVPKPAVDSQALLEYLNSETASAWLRANCQRAANGFYRLQSATLKRLPAPVDLVRPSPPLGGSPAVKKSERTRPRASQRQVLLTAFEREVAA